MDIRSILPVLMMQVLCVCAKQIKSITIGTILPEDNSRLFSINRVEPAMAIALEKVVGELGIITDRNITIHFADSKCNVADGINEAINFFVKKEVDVFFGPCCDYAAAPVGRQIHYWNIAMVTPGAMARDFAEKQHMFNLMTRVGPNMNSLINFVTTIFKTFHWNKVNLLYDPDGQSHIVNKYCHIAIDGLHYGLTLQQQHYFKFDNINMILQSFTENIGKETAGMYILVHKIHIQ